MSHLDGEPVAAGAGAEVIAAGRGGGPGASGDRLALGRARATSSSGFPASATTVASSRSRRCGRAPGAWSRARSGCARSSRCESGARTSSTAGCSASRGPARRAAGPRQALAPRAGCRRGRHHRLDRQDLGQGRLPRRSCPPGFTRAPRTSTPRSGCRWRMLAAPEGTEALVLEMGMRGRRPDRRAVRDRRARRRRDHQRRPGPRRAARKRRGGRGGEGGDHRRAARGGHGGRSAVAGPLEPHLERRPGPAALRRRGRRLRERGETGRGTTEATVVTPAGEQRFSSRSPRRTTSTTRWRRSQRASRSGCRSRGWPSGRRG